MAAVRLEFLDVVSAYDRRERKKPPLCIRPLRNCGASPKKGPLMVDALASTRLAFSVSKAIRAIRPVVKLTPSILALLLANASVAKAEVSSSNDSRLDRLTIGFYLTAPFIEQSFRCEPWKGG
jgi:hypothetical protein